MTDKKQIVIELTIEILREVPVDWDKQQIEFFFNESSHCLSHEIADLGEWNEKASQFGCCDSCGRTSTRYIRDANAEDISVVGIIPTHESIERQQRELPR